MVEKNNNSKNGKDKSNSESDLKGIREELSKLRSDLEEVEKDRREYLEGWKRARADLENFKKDQREEIAKSRKWAKVELVGNLLPALDSFKKALEQSNSQKKGEAWGDGFASIYDQITSILKKQGVKTIEPQEGDEFDPQIHEAVTAEGAGNEHIVDCLQIGYRMDNRVIRPARVKVGDATDGHPS